MNEIKYFDTLTEDKKNSFAGFAYNIIKQTNPETQALQEATIIKYATFKVGNTLTKEEISRETINSDSTYSAELAVEESIESLDELGYLQLWSFIDLVYYEDEFKDEEEKMYKSTITSYGRFRNSEGITEKEEIKKKEFNSDDRTDAEAAADEHKESLDKQGFKQLFSLGNLDSAFQIVNAK